MINLTEGEFLKRELDYSSLKGKEVSIKRYEGEKIEGFVKEVKENTIIIAKNGDWGNETLLPIHEIELIDESEFPYYSESYKRRLRELKKPAFEYRFTEEQLKNLLNKYISLNYDGKIMSGKIIKVHYSKKGNSITIESLDGEIKEIEDYRIREMDITGATFEEHKMMERLIELEEEAILMLEDYKVGNLEGPECKKQDPEVLIEKYFESKIKKTGINFDYDWRHDVIDCTEKFKNESSKLIEEFRKAKDLNDYYESRKLFVDDLVKKVEHIDWSKYSKTHEEGVRQALEYLYESGVALIFIED